MRKNILACFYLSIQFLERTQHLMAYTVFKCIPNGTSKAGIDMETQACYQNAFQPFLTSKVGR